MLSSGLVAPTDVDLAREELRALVPFVDELAAPELHKQWAQRLVESGKLNSWQASQLLVGRAKFNLGSYRIIDAIGQGGMGQVFLAEHVVMGRMVAVKVLPRHKSTPEAEAAFRREVRAQARLDHPNLVRAYDAGFDGNVHYLVTEYVPGTDLRRLVRLSGRLSMMQAASIVSQAAQGLAHAHSLGLIHRDVKPGNLLVRDDGVAKLSDLGLVEFCTENEEGYSPGGKIVGTADYLAPESITAPQTLSPAGDIYALGCTLYYAATGKVPFPGGSVKEKARAHCQLQPLDPRRLSPELSAEFVDVIWSMMVKDPKLRIRTAGEVVTRLGPWTPQTVSAIVIPPATNPDANETSSGSGSAQVDDTQPGGVLLPDDVAGVARAPGMQAGADVLSPVPGALRTTHPISLASEETVSDGEKSAVVEGPRLIFGFPPAMLAALAVGGASAAIVLAWVVLSSLL
ncbi:MAG: serine/threonine protein kinase [Pirellulales bacterium]|nr:serine/threonine protein kinase [Pirellulales bacterium]